jgi:cytochrome bd-type quinol oxidase subunit 2
VIVAAFGRPDTWNWLLLFHLLSALTLVGLVIAVVVARSAAARMTDRQEQSELLRALARRTLVRGVLPAMVLVIVFGDALRGKEDKIAKGTWIDLTYPLAYLSLLLTIALSVMAFLGERRAGLRTAGNVLTPVLLALLGVVVFLMTGKPGA